MNLTGAMLSLGGGGHKSCMIPGDGGHRCHTSLLWVGVTGAIHPSWGWGS